MHPVGYEVVALRGFDLYFLLTDGVEYLLVCCWPSIWHLWKNVCLDSRPVLHLGSWVVCLSLGLLSCTLVFYGNFQIPTKVMRVVKRPCIHIPWAQVIAYGPQVLHAHLEVSRTTPSPLMSSCI